MEGELLMSDWKLSYTAETWFEEAIAKDLLWQSENADNDRAQEALMIAAFHYMTFEQVAKYLGSGNLAEEYFK